MGYLLQLIVPSDASQVLKEKNNTWHFPLFRMSVYGSLLFSGLFYIVVGVGCSLLYNQRGRAMGC